MFSLKNLEKYLLYFGVGMLILSFLTFDIGLSIVDVIGLVIYMAGNAKLLPGFGNSIAKFIGLTVLLVIGIISVIVLILVIFVVTMAL